MVKDEKKIYRKEREHGEFVTVSKHYILDKDLSWKAKGVLTYLLSKPDNWNVIQLDIEKNGKDGREAVASCMKELIEKGYVTRERKKGGSVVMPYDYKVYEDPSLNPNRQSLTDVAENQQQ